MMAAYVNRYGRRGGRGIRPWLLTAKLVGVAGYIGGLAGMAALTWSPPPDAVAGGGPMAPAGGGAGDALAMLHRLVALPGLALAITAGLLLLLQQPGVFLRMRWMRTKLTLFALTAPALNWGLARALDMMRFADAAQDTAAALRLARALLLAALLSGLGLMILGRHKPRLGQGPIRLARSVDRREDRCKEVGA